MEKRESGFCRKCLPTYRSPTGFLKARPPLWATKPNYDRSKTAPKERQGSQLRLTLRKPKNSRFQLNQVAQVFDLLQPKTRGKT
jgi:hypothetical protein